MADSNQLQPDISLMGGGAPGGPSGAGSFNPLETLSRLQALRSAQLQQQQLGQTLSAQQRLGQIMAAAPDLETGLAAASRDPQVMGFGGAALNNARATQQLMVGTQGLQQTQNDTALQGFLKSISSSDPSQLQSRVAAQIQALPEAIRGRVGPALQSATDALVGGLPADPQAAAAEFQKRRVAMMVGSGFSPDAIGALVGTPGYRQEGGQMTPILTRPGEAPQVAGAPTPLTMAPSLQNVPTAEGAPQIGVVTDPRVAGAPVGGGNGLVPNGGGTGGPGPSTAPTAAPGGGLLPATPSFRPIAPPGPTQQQSAFNTGAGNTAADTQARMAEAAQILPSTLNRLNALQTALGQFQAGGGSETRAQLGQALQTLQHLGMNIPQGTVDKVANGSLSDTQVFESLIKPFVVAQLKADTGNAKQFRPEIDSYIDSMSASNDPAALMQILNNTRSQLAVGYDQSQKFLDYKSAIAKKDPSVSGLDLADFPIWYARNFSPLQVPQTNAAGAQLGPTPITNAQGASAPVPKLQGYTDIIQELNQGRITREQAISELKARGYKSGAGGQ